MLRSTPVRLALGLVAIFVLASGLSLWAAYLAVHRSIETAIRADIEQTIAGYGVGLDAPAVATLVAAEAAAADPRLRVLAYVMPGGAVVGNATIRVSGGEVHLAPKGQGALSPDGYLVSNVALRGGILVVGESREPLSHLSEVFATILLVALLPTTVIAMASAAVLAARSARRVSEIETVLAAHEAGDLSVRAPVPPGTVRGRATDLDRIAARLNRAAAAQEAAREALRQVSADIAHDLKTPVQRLVVLMERLRDRLGDADAGTAELADRAVAEAERAVAVFQGLLHIAQIEGTGRQLKLSEVPLGPAARQVTELYEPAAEDSGHRLAFEDRLGPGGRVAGDRVLIQQAISNLIENALRHTPEGTAVTVTVEARDGQGVISVADSGPGIPVDERARVVRRLYRLERSRTTPGNGLGLSLVAAVAEAHHGRLVLEENAPGLVARLVMPLLPETG